MSWSSRSIRLGVVTSTFLVILVIFNIEIMGVDPIGGVEARLAPDGNTVSLWAHFLHSRITRASTPDDVSNALRERSWNTGRIPLGGTGAFELAFRLDDFLELHVLFDGKERIARWTLCRTIAGWLKRPDGTIEFANFSPILSHGFSDDDKSTREIPK